MTRKLFQNADVRWILAASLMGATASSLAQAPLAPTPMVQVPIATTYAGVPAATYSSATSGGSCPSTTTGYLSGNQGCPASQETFYYPYGVAIDGSNNIAVATYGSGQNNTSGVSVVYQGGATMTALITAALPRFTFTPMVGHVYQLANGTQLTLNTTTNGYYCTGSTTGIQSQDQWGDGCPAEYSASQSRYVTMDSQGNIFFSQVYASTTDYQGLKVIYAGGAAVANLITSYFNAHCANWPTGEIASVVTTGNVCALGITPKVGYVYSLSAPNDFVAIRGIGVQVNPGTGGETIYASDNGASTPETGLGAATSGNQIKVFTGTGWATYILGNTTGSTLAVQGDGGPATAAFVDLPSAIVTDASGDLFLLDSTDARIRVVYNGGTTPPLYINGASSYVTTPVVGNIYTVVGGAGTSRVSPTPSYKLNTGSPGPMGIDPQGNFYFIDSSKLTWVVSAVTGMAVNIAGGSSNSASGSTSLAPGAGVACNGSTSPVTGPLMTDAYADGCPATEVSTLNGSGAIVFDTAGNYYMAEGRVTSGATGIVRRYSYNNNFGTVAAGSTQTNLMAFTPYVRTSMYTPTAMYSMTGAATSEYIDAGGANCYTSTTPNIVETCTYNATFAPAAAGERPGSLKLSAAGSTLASIPLSGNGSGAEIALDPATVTTLGTASTYSPAGVAVDQAGNAFMADGTTNNIFESVAGATPVLYATGFSKPAQLAVSGSGTLFVADSGNNRVAMVAAGTPAVVTSFISGLNQPAGVAVDAQGDLFIADTGNNRVLEVPYDLGTYGKTVVLGFTGLSSPLGVAVDIAGDVFVADNGNGRVVELSVTGVQTVISMNPVAVKPVGVALDPAGDLFVADATNQTITEVPFGTTTATVLSGSVRGLNGLAADNFGDLYATASSVSGVIAINRSQITLTYPQTNIGKSNTQTFTMTNSGNQPLNYGGSLSSSTDTVDYSVIPATANGCSASSSLAVGASCGIAGVFQPQSVSAALVDVVSFPMSNAAGGAKATLTGPGQMGLGYMFGTPGTLPNTINVLITATLAVPAPATPINGTVTFNVGGTITTVPVSGGTAVLNTPLSAGTYVVVATYNGTTYPGLVTATVTMVVVTGTSSMALAVTSPTGPITYGQPVVITATTTTGNSTKTAGGTVTFTVNNVVQTPTTFAPAVTYTFSPQAGTYNVCAAYSGDANFVPAQSCTTLTVGRASPTLTLVPTPVVGATNTIGLTATLPAAPTYPTGNITFSYGTTTIGAPVALTNGTASTSTATNLLSSYSFTAAYGGDSNFLPVTVSVTANPALVLSASPASLTVLQNSVGQTTLLLNSFYGYSAANVTFSCTGLPSYATCAANPAVAVQDAITKVPLQIFTDVSPLAIQSKVEGGKHSEMALAFASIVIGCCLVGRRRKRWISLAMLMSLGMLGMSGCSASSSGTQYVTPTGTYTIMIVANDGTTKYTTPFTLTVTPGYLTARPN